MPRVLILGLYYPPANFMAARRLEGWARHLPSFGYEPLVLTRYYDPDELNKHDFYAASRPTRTLPDPWVELRGAVYTRFRPSLWTRIPLPGMVRGLVHYAWPDPDHSVWVRECRQYLAQAKFKPDLIIGSHGPFGMFRVARKLAKWLDVPWLADFRDLWIHQFDWSQDTRAKCFLQRRHLRTAAGITVASDAMATTLRRQLAPLGKPIRLIYNGAEPANGVQPDAADQQTLEAFRSLLGNGMVLTYAGTLYPEQEIERFLNAVAEFNRLNGNACTVVLCGRHQRERYVQWPFVQVLEPVSHSTAVFMLGQSTAVFYPNRPQWYSGFSGKFFEQVLSGRPVLIAFQPSHDLEVFSRQFESVVIARSSDELITVLGRLQRTGARDASPVPEIATKKYWAGELARFFDSILARQRK